MFINLVVLLLRCEHSNVARVRYFWPATVDLRALIHFISMDIEVLGSGGTDTLVVLKVMGHGCERNLSAT